MTADQIEDLRSALSEVLQRYAYPTEDAKIINECKAVLNTLRDYTARLKGYNSYSAEVHAVRTEVDNWHNMEVVFTPHPNK
jgi:hypothetical protein